jgi:Fasciclin domain
MTMTIRWPFPLKTLLSVSLSLLLALSSSSSSSSFSSLFANAQRINPSLRDAFRQQATSLQIGKSIGFNQPEQPPPQEAEEVEEDQGEAPPALTPTAPPTAGGMNSEDEKDGGCLTIGESKKTNQQHFAAFLLVAWCLSSYTNSFHTHANVHTLTSPFFSSLPFPVETICALSGGFDTACELFGDLKYSPDLNYTAFVFTDSAYEEVQLLDSIIISDNTTTALVEFHLVKGHAFQLADLLCQERITMSNGQDSRTVCRDGAKFQKGGDNTEPVPIIIADLPACNGRIQILDGVLLPEGIFGEEINVNADAEVDADAEVESSVPQPLPTTTTTTAPPSPTMPPQQQQQPQPLPTDSTCIAMVDFICNSRVLSQFCELIRAYNLEDDLKAVPSITAFAPYNLAFAEFDFESLDFDTARDVIIFHATANNLALSLSELQCGELLPMANGKDTRTYCFGDDIFQKGAGNPLSKMPKLLVKDIAVCNGYVHIVDRVLVPSISV